VLLLSIDIITAAYGTISHSTPVLLPPCAFPACLTPASLKRTAIPLPLSANRQQSSTAISAFWRSNGRGRWNVIFQRGLSLNVAFCSALVMQNVIVAAVTHDGAGRNDLAPRHAAATWRGLAPEQDW